MTRKKDCPKETSELIEQYERRIYYLKQLLEVGKGMNSTLEYNVLIDSILLTCMGQLKVLNAGIFLLKGLESDIFTLHRNYKGFELSHNMDYSFSSKSKLVQFIKKNIKCYKYDELTGHMDRESKVVLENLKPEIIVPLQSKGEINGVMFLGKRINMEEVNASESEYLMGIASLASIAINNARLYEMATTDMMTKLKMHHYFQARLAKEVQCSIKDDCALSVMMIDIDHFKKFNDRHGHAAGDKILRNVAKIIKSEIRLIDIAARYGGEEFAVILPKTEINEALIAAERIRKSIEKSVLDYNGTKLTLTVSIGLTKLDPKLDKGKEDLVNRADRALYISKNKGRNMVSCI